MTVMTTQPPLPLIPAGAIEISAAAAMIEDEHGGRVFVHGHLVFAWDGGDTAGRRFAAVSLMRIKAATQVQVAAAFDTSPLTLWRWAQALSAAGVSALVPHRKGPCPARTLMSGFAETCVNVDSEVFLQWSQSTERPHNSHRRAATLVCFATNDIPSLLGNYRAELSWRQLVQPDVTGSLYPLVPPTRSELAKCRFGQYCWQPRDPARAFPVPTVITKRAEIQRTEAGCKHAVVVEPLRDTAHHAWQVIYVFKRILGQRNVKCFGDFFKPTVVKGNNR
nr:hypothetical protein [Candidatus Mycolicibacterium alkanivorans]